MDNWKPAPDRPGYRRKIIQRGMATIIIDRPILTEEQEAKAQRQTRTTLENVMREHYSRTARRTAV